MPKSNRACGVLATANSLRVAILTALSVDCADNITAINNSNVLLYSSSVEGFEMARLRRL